MKRILIGLVAILAVACGIEPPTLSLAPPSYP
jgi:hypothetical protein